VPDEAQPTSRLPRAARRAAVFGVLLVVIGAVAVWLRIFRSGLHPPIVFALSHQARARAMLDWRKQP
jgi:hypothetical protein